jgi:hypothetical protein
MAVAGTANSAAPTTARALGQAGDADRRPSSAASSAATAPPSARAGPADDLGDEQHAQGSALGAGRGHVQEYPIARPATIAPPILDSIVIAGNTGRAGQSGRVSHPSPGPLGPSALRRP